MKLERGVCATKGWRAGCGRFCTTTIPDFALFPASIIRVHGICGDLKSGAVTDSIRGIVCRTSRDVPIVVSAHSPSQSSILHQESSTLVFDPPVQQKRLYLRYSPLDSQPWYLPRWENIEKKLKAQTKKRNLKQRTKQPACPSVPPPSFMTKGECREIKQGVRLPPFPPSNIRKSMRPGPAKKKHTHPSPSSQKIVFIALVPARIPAPFWQELGHCSGAPRRVPGNDSVGRRRRDGRARGSPGGSLRSRSHVPFPFAACSATVSVTVSKALESAADKTYVWPL